jgi:hypothetical protein
MNIYTRFAPFDMCSCQASHLALHFFTLYARLNVETEGEGSVQKTIMSSTVRWSILGLLMEFLSLCMYNELLCSFSCAGLILSCV